MATDDPSSDRADHQSAIDEFMDRPADATSRTGVDGDVVETASSSSDESAQETRHPPVDQAPAAGAVPESPDEAPDPDSPAVQAAATAGRAALSPVLAAIGSREEVATPEGRYHEAAHEIVESLQTVARRGYATATVFSDWIDILLYALASGDHEAAYQETAERYAFDADERGDRGIDYLATATGQLVTGMLETGADLLGDVYHLLGRSSDDLGQFFTPHNVAVSKVEMLGIGADASSEYGRGDRSPEAFEERVGVQDPACGSGRLLVPAARTHPDGWYAGVDLDPTCAKMAAINLLFCNVDAQIVHGNSLTREAYRVYDVGYTQSGGVLSINSPDEVPTVLDG